MVKKLVLITSLVILSSTLVEAMQTPEKENRDSRIPGAPKKPRAGKPRPDEDARVIRCLDYNSLADDTEE